ncbi:MAG: class II aldolase/adducin family protein [Gemmataceae bacterium]|nr:class II aldolase/adducin family protein [Gemmataceae bacterium]
MSLSEHKLKEQICEIGRRLYNKGFAAANDGNITVRLNDKEILCTPTLVSKGFMKPEDICKVDYEGKQIAGTRKRTSEVLLHLVVYKNRPDVQSVVHCHPPHATAFAVAGEPIPKCVLPEVEVFLGEIPIAPYATPGDQRLPNSIAPFVKDCNTILLANHGTVSWGPNVEGAYFNTEIIDAYCRILILSKILGRVNYFSEGHNRELMEFKKRLKLDDPRLKAPDCETCGPSTFSQGYGDFIPEAFAFRPDLPLGVGGASDCECGSWSDSSAKSCSTGACPSPNGKQTQVKDMDDLVRTITDQVMAAMGGAKA